MKLNRRQFLQSSGAAMAAGSVPFCLTLPSTAMASGSNGYKALVAVYFAGGNDSFNMVLPRSAENYAQFKQARPSGVALESILPTGLYADNGVELGMHPSMPNLAQLLSEQKGSAIINVGPLIEPLNGRTGLRPSSLGSHSTGTKMWRTRWNPETQSYVGSWLGAMMDFLYDPNAILPESINVSGFGIAGKESTQLKMRAGDTPGLGVLSNSSSFSQQYHNYSSQVGQTPFDKEWLARLAFLQETQDQVNDQLSQYPPDETITGGSLASSLQTVKQMMQAAKGIGHSRQVFTVVMGGFDTHKASNDHLLAQIDAVLSSFYSSLERDGLIDDTVIFTMSDFGRSINENANKGTDHGWGANQLVLGGAVDGTKAHGLYPQFIVDSEDAYGNKFKPSQSSEQMAATLGRWFGLSESAVDHIFPSLNPANDYPFSSRYLSFLPLGGGQAPAEALPPFAIDASAENPNGTGAAINAVDGDPNTKWSAQGTGITYTIMLSEPSDIDFIKLRQDKGDVRQYFADVMVSSDGVSFEQVANFTSPGNTNSWVEQTVGRKEVQFVRLVCNGNNDPDNASLRGWNNFSGIEIWGRASVY